MIIDKEHFRNHDMSKLVKGAVVPRPIAWVSTVSTDGVANLAPFSFFTVASLDPITLCVSISPSNKLKGEKDTLTNIKEIEEFVIHIVAESDVEQMHETSKNFDANENEFEKIGIKSIASEQVNVPRIENAAVAMECHLDKIIKVGESDLVLGELVCYHIKDRVYMDNDKVNQSELNVIGRMAGDYTYIRNFFTLPK